MASPVFASTRLGRAGNPLIVEFVPKSDPKVATLLATREDVFPAYTREGFESAFATCFELEVTDPLVESERILYRMGRRPKATNAPRS